MDDFGGKKGGAGGGGGSRNSLPDDWASQKRMHWNTPSEQPPTAVRNMVLEPAVELTTLFEVIFQ